MSDEYLGDGSGTPDSEVERREEVLVRFRTAPAQFEFPTAAVAPTSPPRTRSRRTESLRIAAAAALPLGSIWLLRALTGRASWTIAGVEGSPRIDGKTAQRNDGWKMGQSLETDGASRVKLRVDGLGEIEVGRNASLVLLEANATQQQIRSVR